MKPNLVRVRQTLLGYDYAFTAFGLLVVLLLVAALRGPKLFTSEGLTIAASVLAPLVLAAMAATPVAISGRGGADLSVGPLMAFLNVAIVTWLINEGLTGVVPVVAFALAAGALFGLIQGLLVSLVRLQPVVVTLSGFLFLSGLANVIHTNGSEATFPNWLSSLSGTTAGIPTAAIVVAAICLAWVPVARSTYYRNLRLVGFDDRTAYASGVNVALIRAGAYVLGGLLGGVAALMLSSLLISASPNVGTNYTLIALTALVLGGTSLAGGSGGMVGSVLGAIDVYLIQYALATFQFGKSSEFVNQVANGGVLLIALLLGAVAVSLNARRRATA